MAQREPDQVAEIVRAAWRDLLGPDDIEPGDDFFAAGGDSLLLVRLADRLHRALHRDVPVHELLMAPTLAGMVAVAGRSADAAGQPAVRQPVRPSARRLPDGLYPAAAAENGVPAPWIAHGMWTFGLRIAGTLDLDLLAEALSWVSRRHAALRTRFAGTSHVPECAAPEAIECPLVIMDLGAAGQLTEELARKRLRGPFDLAAAPLVRSVLLRAAAGQLLGVAVHSAVFDARSVGSFLTDLAYVYRCLAAGERGELGTEQSDFAAFALAERQGRELGVAAAELMYWATRRPAAASLASPPPVAPSAPRPAERYGSSFLTVRPADRSVGGRPGGLLTAAGAALSAALLEITAAAGVQFLVVVPRREEIAARGGIGPYATLRPVTCMSRDPMQVARLAAAQIAAGLGNGTVPFAALAGQRIPWTDVAGRPAVVVLDAPPALRAPDLGTAGCQVAWAEEEPGAECGLTVTCRQTDAGGIELRCTYSPAYFADAAIRTLLGSMAARL